MANRLETSDRRTIISSDVSFVEFGAVSDSICGRSSAKSDPQGYQKKLREALLFNNHTHALSVGDEIDGFAFIESKDAFITPHQLVVLLFDCLAESRNWSGGVAQSTTISRLVDSATALRGLPNYEPPVGFKYIGELINEDQINLGRQESTGLSFKGHGAEKDGLSACLFAAPTVAAGDKNLIKQRR